MVGAKSGPYGPGPVGNLSHRHPQYDDSKMVGKGVESADGRRAKDTCKRLDGLGALGWTAYLPKSRSLVTAHPAQIVK